ncbi:MAG: DUF885 domain-containing protein [Dehalococcoidia bacterium]
MAEARSEIFSIASQYVDEVAALDPFEATGMGVPGHDAEVTDFSPDGQAQRAALRRRTLAELERTTHANPDDELARAVMQDALSAEQERYQAGDEFYAVGTLATPAHALVESFDLMPKDSSEAWQNIIHRLEQLPNSAASIRALLEAGMVAGKLAARRQVEAALRQLTSYAGHNPEAPAAFAGLPDDLEGAGLGSAAPAAELKRAIDAGRQAFETLHAFLSQRYLNSAPIQEAAGRERYIRAARRFLGSTIDPEATYAWGWEEVRRLAGEMRSTAERIRPGATTAQATEILDADSARTILGEPQLISWLQNFQDAAIRAMDGVYVDIPEPAKRIEACIAPPGGALAQYYTPPSEDFSRPGRTWYPTGGHSEFHRWRDTSTAYHEGVPGHHLQCAFATLQAEHLSRYQRVAVWYSGHGEGWALYAERLMAELGFLADPGDYMGMLIGQMLRAARVVVDIGVHLQLPIPRDPALDMGQAGERWSYERMLAFLTEQVRLPADEAQSEVVRYLGWPGQAISYKVGERAWLQIREESRARHGAAFSLRTFHNTALALGPVGLDLLRESVRNRY